MSDELYDFASLSPEEQRHALNAHYTQRFIINPNKLTELSIPTSLTWQQIHFVKTNVQSVSDKTGVYAFVIKNSNSLLPQHGYIAYIGQAGAGHVNRSLRARCREYFSKRIERKRPTIHALLTRWSGSLVFYFASVDASQFDLLDIEAGLNDAIMPPYSTNDFTAKIRRGKKLWSLS
jgi:hypothetical protein